ncbi:MAG: hypothetical protein ABEN55_12460 [Bradymonadaceae bacterium]
MTAERFVRLLDEEIEEQGFEGGRFDEAIELFRRLSTSDNFVEFLTLPAYELLED